MLSYASPNHWVKLILLIHSKVRQATTPLGIWQRGRPSASIPSLNSWSPLKSVGLSEARTECSGLGNSRSNCVPKQLHIHLLWRQGRGGCGKEQRQGSDIQNAAPELTGVYVCSHSGIYMNTKYSTGFPGGSDGKESACKAGDLGSIPGLGRYLGEGKGYPLQRSCLENSMDKGTWWATVHGVAKSRTWRYCVCVNPNLPIHPTLSFPHCELKSVLPICISITALRTGASVAFL